jgi:hypothetical protein
MQPAQQPPKNRTGLETDPLPLPGGGLCFLVQGQVTLRDWPTNVEVGYIGVGDGLFCDLLSQRSENGGPFRWSYFVDGGHVAEEYVPGTKMAYELSVCSSESLDERRRVILTQRPRVLMRNENVDSLALQYPASEFQQDGTALSPCGLGGSEVPQQRIAVRFHDHGYLRAFQLTKDAAGWWN